MKRTLLIFALLILAIPVHIAFAQQGQQYVPIVGLPIQGGASASTLDAEQFVRVIYILAVSLAALLAVVKIIYGGVQYMLTDVVTSKEQAKKDIWGAIFGLLIVLSAVFILEIINPQLTRINLLNVEQISISARNSAVAPANGSAGVLGGSVDAGNTVTNTNNDFGLTGQTSDTCIRDCE